MPLLSVIDMFGTASAIAIITLSFWAVLFPGGFRVLGAFLLVISIILVLTKHAVIVARCRSTARSVVRLMRQREYQVYFAIIGVFLAKVIFFSLFKPVIDPDVVNYYLPFARSIAISDNVPNSNLYSTLPIIHTPIGSLVIPALIYSVLGSTTSEMFRLINLPYITSLLIIIYRFVRRFTNSRLIGLQTVTVFVGLPMIDSLLFEALFYPDFIFTFYCLLALERLYSITNQDQSSLKSFVILALYLSTAMLIKFQAVWLLPFFALWFSFHLHLSTNLKKTIIIGFAIIFSGLRLLQPATLPSPHPLILLLAPLFLYLLFRPPHWPHRRLQLPLGHILISLTILLLGGLWFIRNLLIFGNILVRTTPTDNWVYSLQGEESKALGPYQVDLDPLSQKLLSWINLDAVNYAEPLGSLWAILFWPGLGSLWLIFKIIGLLKAKQSNYFFPFVWTIYWYLVWIFYLGAVSDRHLLPLLPFLSLIIVLGINALRNLISPAKVIFLISLLSLAQSRFLSWNLGVALVGRTRLKTLADSLYPTTEPNRFSINSTVDYVKRFLSAINAPGDSANSFIVYLIVFSLSAFGLCFLFRRTHLPNFILTSAIFLFPYIATIVLVTNFQPQFFTHIEQDKVYSYAGQFESVIPRLESTLLPTDRIIFLGTPTGLSYYLNHPVLDFLNSSDIASIKPVFDSKDSDEINNFLNANHYRYIVLLDDPLIQKKLNFLKTKSYFFSHIFEPSVSRLIVIPTASSSWYVYQII